MLRTNLFPFSFSGEAVDHCPTAWAEALRCAAPLLGAQALAALQGQLPQRVCRVTEIAKGGGTQAAAQEPLHPDDQPTTASVTLSLVHDLDIEVADGVELRLEAGSEIGLQLKQGRLIGLDVALALELIEHALGASTAGGTLRASYAGQELAAEAALVFDESLQEAGAQRVANGPDWWEPTHTEISLSLRNATVAIHQKRGPALGTQTGRVGSFLSGASGVRTTGRVGGLGSGGLLQMLSHGALATQSAPQTAGQPAVQMLKDNDVVQRVEVTLDAKRKVETQHNPSVFENAARAFERKMPTMAAPKAMGVVGDMCNNAYNYIQNKAAKSKKALLGVDAEVLFLLKACGEAKSDRAGAVGENPFFIREVLMTVAERQKQIAVAKRNATALEMYTAPPSLREQMTFIRNFVRAILAPDLLSDKTLDVAERLGVKTAAERTALEQRVAAARAQAAERQASATQANAAAAAAAQAAEGPAPAPKVAKPLNVLDIVDAIPSKGLREAESVKHGVANENDVISGVAPAAAKNPKAQAGQEHSRIDPKDVKAHLDAQRAAAAAGPGGAAAAAAIPNFQVPAPQSGILAGPISNGATMDPLAITPREAALQKIKATDVLKWSEGERVWLANLSDPWVQAIRELGLPYAAGPSGMTNSTLNAAQMLGCGDRLVEVRGACIAFLINIHAHSLVEVLTAGAGFGLPFTIGKTMYEAIEPYTPAELRSCGEDGLFPREVEQLAAQQAAARANAGAAPTPTAAATPAVAASASAGQAAPNEGLPVPKGSPNASAGPPAQTAAPTTKPNTHVPHLD